MFCIIGNLRDVYCTRDLKLLGFEELLSGYLRDRGFDAVIFFSGALGRLKTVDKASRDFLNGKAAKSAKKAGMSKFKRAGEPRGAGGDDGDRDGKLPYERAGLEDSLAVAELNRFMTQTEKRVAVIFTSLDDFVNKTSPENRRVFNACFDDWKSLGTENRNICVFLSKNLDAGNIQQIFTARGEMSMASLFVSENAGAGASFNKNSCLIVRNPRNDEIASLLEYLRVVGIRRVSSGKETRVRLTFNRFDFETLTRETAFYGRESDITDLKPIKEKFEKYMASSEGDKVFVDPKILRRELFPECAGDYNRDDPMELLKTTRGWETAARALEQALTAIPKPEENEAAQPAAGNSEFFVQRLGTRRETGGEAPVPNFVLQGPPGVGKSEIAGLIGRILSGRGILKSGHTVVANRSGLVGQYVGSSAINTANMIEQAQEGVLLIDEVYSLVNKGGGSSSGENYCAEVFNTLVAAMTDKSKRFCVIFSGYESKMDDVWQMNEGLYSRFGEGNVIDLDDFPPPVLMEIFAADIKKSGISLDGEVARDLPVFFQNYYNDRDRLKFANARDIKNLARTVIRAAFARSGGRVSECTVTKADFGRYEKSFIKRGSFDENDVYRQLRRYTGLGFLEEMFDDQSALFQECADKKLPYPGPIHMIWCGNPGTGKSTAAKLTAELYHFHGILGGTNPVYVDAGTLLGQYVGQAQQLINEKMDEAVRHNTVLVIEEAYQLLPENCSFGRSVVNAMLNRMEEDRPRFNVIFILYGEYYDAFLKINPGLESRTATYWFPDYTSPQLRKILRKMLGDGGDAITAPAYRKAALKLRELYKSGDSRKGNARIVRKMLEDMRQKRFKRMRAEKSGDKYLFVESDVAVEKYVPKKQLTVFSLN
jgi:replication-associated recombination protein RarA